MTVRNNIRIGDKIVGKGYPTFIIAEIGSNHDGSLAKAKELIVGAAKAGADAVKFQSFRADGLVSPGAGADFAKAFDVLKALELKTEWHQELKRTAEQNNMEFLSAPFTFELAQILKELDVVAFKIASGDLTYLAFIEQIAKFHRPVLLSTGAGTVGEIDTAIEGILKQGNDDIILLHCIASYPLKAEEANLKAISALELAFGFPVGFSDHSLGWSLDIAAVTLGAAVIEKHMTLNRDLPGPDHWYALTDEEFGQMVNDIRHIESALGDGQKKVVAGEEGARFSGRRGIYSARRISKGTVIEAQMLKCVRPNTGIPADKLEFVVGRVLKVDLENDRPLEWNML